MPEAPCPSTSTRSYLPSLPSGIVALLRAAGMAAHAMCGYRLVAVRRKDRTISRGGLCAVRCGLRLIDRQLRAGRQRAEYNQPAGARDHIRYVDVASAVHGDAYRRLELCRADVSRDTRTSGAYF